MSKIVIAMAFAAGLIAGTFMNLTPKSSHAQLPCAIAKSYGTVKAALSPYLVLEASDGMIHLIHATDCSTIRVISRN
jgi:hypothetical protein